MGIRGLATFIACCSEKYFEDYKLNDCYLVIDGNSFACQLYGSSSKFNNAFGGDYDRFATSVIEFFDALKKCRIAPLVIFDGGYEGHKLKTTLSRIKEKWTLAKNITPMTPHRSSVFPCFLKEVVKEVLRELQIPFAQCLFEADSEIAAVARHLKCPVLSYDSDFFVYNVLYVPFPTLHQIPCKDISSQLPDVKYYLSCSLYRIENFLKRYGGLQKEILPFLSIMLGCDYIGNRVYKHFVSNLKQKKCRRANQRQRRIGSLLEWLRTETLESAKSKVVGCIRKHQREGLKNQIKKIISMYLQESSELLPFLGIEVSTIEMLHPSDEKHIIDVLDGEQDLNNDWPGSDLDSDASEERNDATCSSNISSDSDELEISDGEKNEKLVDFVDEEKMTCSWELRKASCLPEWFLDRYKHGDLPSVLMDMIIHNMYFPPPQVEDYDYPSSHVISIPIIAVIYGLLVGCECVKPLQCHIRKHLSRGKCIEITPVLESASVKFPPLEDLPKLSMLHRLSIIVETAGLSSVELKTIATLPDSWQLYIIALVFWARQTISPLVNSSHIRAVLLCLILLDVVGKNVICLGSSKKNRRKQKKDLKKARSNDSALFTCALLRGNTVQVEHLSKTALSGPVVNQVESEVKREDEQDKLEQRIVCAEEEVHEISNCVVEALENVRSEECGFVKQILRPMCLMDEKMKTRPKLFCVSVVHTFAQFQSCLLHFSYLNTLLGNPLLPCKSFRAFSGMFVYNIYNNLKQRTNAIEYLSHLLSTAPTISTLFKCLIKEVEFLVPNVPSTDHAKRKSRKKKLRCNIKRTEDVSVEDDEKSTNTDFEDPCNPFTALSVN